MTHGRFNLDDEERTVVHFALQQCAKRIMDKAAADEYAREDLAGAAATFHLATTLAHEVGATVGFNPPSAETVEMAAMCIAEGEAPFAARMAAEVEAPAALGAYADISVTPAEDEATA